MLSRVALQQAQILPIMARGAQALSSAANNRPVRLEKPPPVRFGFVPDSWFTFFYPKTGVTGPYTFGVTLTTYLVSKEIYVLEHEYYSGISLLIICVVAVKKLGPVLAAYLDKELDQIESGWKELRESKMRSSLEAVEMEKEEQWRAEGQKLLIEAKKENVALQLEAAYRERLANVYSEVKRRLDYQVQIQNIERRLAQKHMVQWIINNVLKSITPEQEKATLQQCISDLQGLAARA